MLNSSVLSPGAVDGAGWVNLRCDRSLKAKLHREARIIEVACHQGKKTHHGHHAFDWFDADTGQRLELSEVEGRLSICASGVEGH